MLITDLNKMEQIVSSNPSLTWSGWDVIQLTQDDYAEYLSVGVFNRETSKWYKKTVFPCTEDGWDIPESVM
jgi:hypothetical protein